MRDQAAVAATEERVHMQLRVPVTDLCVTTAIKQPLSCLLPMVLPFPYSFQLLYAKSRKEGQVGRERVN